MSFAIVPPRENFADPESIFGAVLTRAAAGDVAASSVRWQDGSVSPLNVRRWLDPATPAELKMLEHVEGPVLDVGCGPARHVLALTERWAPALGIDPVPAAVELGRRRGASVIERSVFDDVPCGGRWGTGLLLDGNIGIGGDPVALLRRLRVLLRGAGLVLAELDTDDVGLRTSRCHLETPFATSTSFMWSRVGAAGIERVAATSRFDVVDVCTLSGRCFARLRATR